MKLKINWLILGGCVSFLMLLSCNKVNPKSSPTVLKDTISDKKDTITIKIDDYLTKLADFMSGKTAEGKFSEYSNDSDYVKFQKLLNKEWRELDSLKLTPISNWSKQEIPAGKSNTLFYPFAGGDFLYANAYFPNVSHTIMIGLEPAGFIHTLDTMSKDEVFAYLSAVHKSLFFSNKYGFFRTNSMKTEFGQKLVNGTIHPVLLHIARYNYDISEINYCNLDTSGNIIYTGATENHIGYEIKYTDGKSEKTLHYFSFDLYDGSMKRNQRLLPFVKKDGDNYLLLKSASYLPQYSTYKIITDFMLSQAVVIVQDDSGIPYKMLNNSDWKVSLFGDHTGNLPMFRNYNQKDLQEAYAQMNPKKNLPFEIGYNVTKGKTCIIIAEKNN